MGGNSTEGLTVGRPTSVSEMSFGAALEHRAAEMPDELAFRLIEHGEDDRTLTFADLHRKAQDIAALLLEKIPATGRALLLFPPGIDYVCALYGCFQAGIVAVSAPPPQPNRLHRTLPRLQAIAADAEIAAVLTIDFIKQAAESDAAESFLTNGPLTEVLSARKTPPSKITLLLGFCARRRPTSVPLVTTVRLRRS